MATIMKNGRTLVGSYASDHLLPQAPRPAGISVCICTIGRARLLCRCLESIRAGSEQPLAVCVSDDSGGRDVNDVCAKFGATYLVGPRRGIAANRNHVVKEARTSHVALLDDDVEVGPNFFRDAAQIMRRLRSDEIASGTVVKEGVPTLPSRPGYLGFFSEATPDTVACFHLNANVIPTCAFEIAAFDERIEYGYEDMDLATRLLRAGFRISHWPHLVTYHPQADGVDADPRRHRQSERARYLVALERHRHGRSGWAGAGVYAFVAAMHSVLHAIKVGESPVSPIADMHDAWRLYRRANASALRAREGP
jgi:GT2 family glycosyltransferase